MTTALRGTMFLILDRPDEEFNYSAQIITIDGCASAEEFKKRAVEYVRLAADRLEFGPIGEPWELFQEPDL